MNYSEEEVEYKFGPKVWEIMSTTDGLFSN